MPLRGENRTTPRAHRRPTPRAMWSSGTSARVPLREKVRAVFGRNPKNGGAVRETTKATTNKRDIVINYLYIPLKAPPWSDRSPLLPNRFSGPPRQTLDGNRGGGHYLKKNLGVPLRGEKTSNPGKRLSSPGRGRRGPCTRINEIFRLPGKILRRPGPVARRPRNGACRYASVFDRSSP